LRADLEDLKDKVSIVELIEYLGGEVRSGYGEWKPTRCPFHTDRTASASTGRIAFVCHGCGAPERDDGKAGDIFDVAKHHLQTNDFREAREWIEKTFS